MQYIGAPPVGALFISEQAREPAPARLRMNILFSILAVAVLAFSPAVHAADTTPLPSHGIPYPEGWQNWAPISMSYRADNNTVRIIYGNDVAVNAARSGNTDPWPDKAILGKAVWKETKLENWKVAAAPGEFIHAEFMFKDSKKYSDTHGWGWARWVGMEQEPFEKGMDVCITCHRPVSGRDWVFTDPAVLP